METLYPTRKMKKKTEPHLSYSRANSSWPIFGISGNISNTEESEATLSHDSARLIPWLNSASDAVRDEILNLCQTIYVKQFI